MGRIISWRARWSTGCLQNNTGNVHLQFYLVSKLRTCQPHCNKNREQWWKICRKCNDALHSAPFFHPCFCSLFFSQKVSFIRNSQTMPPLMYRFLWCCLVRLPLCLTKLSRAMKKRNCTIELQLGHYSERRSKLLNLIQLGKLTLWWSQKRAWSDFVFKKFSPTQLS